VRPAGELIQDRYIAQSLVLERAQEHVTDEVDLIITALHRRLARLVREHDPASSKKAQRYVERKAAELIDAAYERIERFMRGELRDVAKLEVQFAGQTLTDVLRQAMEAGDGA
jgi:hypothetical protein